LKFSGKYETGEMPVTLFPGFFCNEPRHLLRDNQNILQPYEAMGGKILK